MFLFRSHFKLTTSELNSMRGFLIFVVKMCVKAWYGCPNGINSANYDLNLLREAYEFAKNDKIASQAATKKVQNFGI